MLSTTSLSIKQKSGYSAVHVEIDEPRFTVQCRGAGCFRGAILFVLFGWLWMTFSLLVFLIGPPLDKIFCSVIQDPDFYIIDTVSPAWWLLSSLAKQTK